LRGLSWIIAPTNEAFAVARQRAGEDARARAQQYAVGLNVNLGPVAWASEPGLRTTDPYGRMSSSGDVMYSRAAPADESISVTSDELTVSAALEVGFRILQKDSS
jgi:uncharacterized protein YggE